MRSPHIDAVVLTDVCREYRVLEETAKQRRKFLVSLDYEISVPHVIRHMAFGSPLSNL